ncbi:hypothetical protein OG689_11040 [Kitasatospora sp. NBC_00240]|uniref:hypothetical protein n=1 Tax=Kitasatospora sp. NBC_00240 TaxID=2903567 RepID=UPI0022513960|nr:hypothetical protein [Kitasatospora sp. NBC_00240]MCX5209820.1 hypothetical protein [Kitasatospora sp. NBC_00240]
MALKVTGLTDVVKALEGMVARVEAATPLAIITAQSLIEGEARARLSRYSHPRRTPTPAPAGGPPALVTGRLRSSFDMAGPTPAGAGVWLSAMGPTAAYSRIQELGGSTGRTQLPARPYLWPSFDAVHHSGRLEDTFHRAWARAITG